MRQRTHAELIAAVLAGSWRCERACLSITADELSEVAPMLIRSGAGALAWWRIRNSELTESDAGIQLKQSYRLHRLEASVREQRIKRILGCFRENDIEPVLVKGWNCARLYPEPGLRHFFDIDLCVAHRDYQKAQSIIATLGEDGIYVDLHDELDHLDSMPWAQFFARTELIDLDDMKVRVPCPEDHLRIICVHWLRHGAWKPAGLCDVAASIEALPATFDWQRCLGSDPIRANWVTTAIALARELLGAEVLAKSEELRAENQGANSIGPTGKIGSSVSTPSALPFALGPLPAWLVPALMRQWERSFGPNYREPALPSLYQIVTSSSDGIARWKNLARDLYARWDHPVRATIAVRGRFNNWPRLPYQLGELLLHSREVPKQLLNLIQELLTPKASNRSAQGRSLENYVPQTIQYPERV